MFRCCHYSLTSWEAVSARKVDLVLTLRWVLMFHKRCHVSTETWMDLCLSLLHLHLNFFRLVAPHHVKGGEKNHSYFGLAVVVSMVSAGTTIEEFHCSVGAESKNWFHVPCTIMILYFKRLKGDSTNTAPHMEKESYCPLVMESFAIIKVLGKRLQVMYV